MSVHVSSVELAGKADANSLEPKSTDLGSRSFAPLHARDIIDRPGRMRVVSRVCSCLARRLRLYNLVCAAKVTWEYVLVSA